MAAGQLGSFPNHPCAQQLQQFCQQKVYVLTGLTALQLSRQDGIVLVHFYDAIL